jgi:uncharacterized protein (TIGR02757 family)
LEETALKEFLDHKVNEFNNPGFIEDDPIGIPHRYSRKEDIEIAGFLVAVISWGNRKAIVKSGHRMMDLLGNSPYEFVMNHHKADLKKLEGFVHRTFNGKDFVHLIRALKYLYETKGGMEAIFYEHSTPDSLQPAIHHFKKMIYSSPHPARTTKHVPDPFRGSAAKRINMYLRWMVRKDKKGVDFGIWPTMSPRILSCPLDLHSGNTARKLDLLTRKQNDSKAVTELDQRLRQLDKEDPVKYDFALFGLGIFEGF